MGSSGVFISLILVSSYIRTVKTASGAIAVHVVFSERKSAKRMKHIGSAHSESELALCELRLNASSMVTNSQWTSARLHTPTGNRQRFHPAAGSRSAGWILAGLY